VTALADPLGDLREWLPRSAAGISEPDTDGTAGHGKAGSRPPWNQAAANATWDAIAAISETVAMFGFLVHGTVRPPYPYSATGQALDAIGRLGEAVPQDRARQAARELQRAVTAILQLPAIDEAERPQAVTVPCPYCHVPMMRLFPRAGLVVCLRGGFACLDGDGNPPKGHARQGRLGAQIEWEDGLVT
jgi:hypothetical protein